MKATSIFAAAIMAAATTASAQTIPAPGDGNARRDQIHVMEGVLTAAVRAGAANLARRIQVNEPGSLIVTGTARARGFVLDGYGVFFDVDVPMMRQSVVWSTLMTLRELQRQRLRQLMATAPDEASRRNAEMELRRLESPAGAAPSQVAQSGQPAQAGQPAQGMATAQSVTEPGPIDITDPNEAYTQAVKTALVDAMLDYSRPMNVAPDEWLTVAARDSEGPLTPGALDDATTLVLRIKGSDLEAFFTKKISREEARAKVQVHEF